MLATTAHSSYKHTAAWRTLLRHGAHLRVLGLGGYFALSTFIRMLRFSIQPTHFVALLLAPLSLAPTNGPRVPRPANQATKVDPCRGAGAD